jgi:2-polyprenyl-3-methyl-5-hydroxy-6-metoxy-1,4-benzoquinol methylase
MSDWDGYAIPLSHKLGYTNTYYHQEPRLDINNIPPELEHAYDFILSTDVFEHVLPPIQKAFDNTRRLLKPNGTFIFSVPFSLDPSTIEHFPDIHQFEIIKENDTYILKNTTRDGIVQTFDKLVFHGGPGSTLEMRVFSKKAIYDHLKQAGFREIRFREEMCLKFGIHWKDKWSLPITARA